MQEDYSIPWRRFEGMSCMNCMELKLTQKGLVCKPRLKTRCPIKRVIQGLPQIFLIVAPRCNHMEENFGDLSCEICTEVCKYFETCGYKDKPIRREG